MAVNFLKSLNPIGCALRIFKKTSRENSGQGDPHKSVESLTPKAHYKNMEALKQAARSCTPYQIPSKM